MVTENLETSGLTIIVPTFNEAENVAELVQRINDSVENDGLLTVNRTEIIFVDDSTDNTEKEVLKAAETSNITVSCIHREQKIGGLGGAVLLGAQSAAHDLCLVMDGDLQHPPERIGDLYREMLDSKSDVVVASRYVGGGDASGLANMMRHGVSITSNALVKAMFPIRLHDCTDPMTGFFLFRKSEIDFENLKPQGFKILLEILARQKLKISEIPFDFGERYAGESKASFKQGAHFLKQLFQLRFGRMSGFALIGFLGAILNVVLVWWLLKLGTSVLFATTVAAEVTIIGNFLLQDRFVFGDLRSRSHGFWGRFTRSFVFNNVEAALRIVIVVILAKNNLMNATLSTALLLVVAFFARYIFHALVIYAPRKKPR